MKKLLSIVIVLSILSATSPALACKCAAPPPPKQALAGAGAVFSGKVTDVTIKENTKYVTVEVDRVWKGEVPAKVVITTPKHGATCGYGFSAEGDATYMIYCYPAEEGQKGLSTGLCTRTRALKDAKEDLKDLGDGEKPKEVKKG